MKLHLMLVFMPSFQVEYEITERYFPFDYSVCDCLLNSSKNVATNSVTVRPVTTGSIASRVLEMMSFQTSCFHISNKGVFLPTITGI
jgi:hypothetical protein